MYYNSQLPVLISARKLRISSFIIEFSIDRTVSRIYATDSLLGKVLNCVYQEEGKAASSTGMVSLMLFKLIE